MTEQRERTHFHGDGCAHHRGNPPTFPVDDLVSKTEIAERLNVTRDRVKQWVTRSASTGFPEPVDKKKQQRWRWDWQEVQAWYGYWRLTRRGGDEGQAGMID